MQTRSPLKVFTAVQKALFLRELNMKVTVGRFGFFWIFFEPFAQVTFFTLLKIAIIQSRGIHSNFDYVTFIAVGFIAFNMFKGILSSSLGAFEANRGLLKYKQVKPIDTILGRVLLQIFITSIIVIVFIFIGFFFKYEIMPQNILLVFLGYCWFLLFSFSLSFFLAVSNIFFSSTKKVVNIFSLGLFIFSGIFYPLISLPAVARDILLYNPLVHFMEMIHAAYILELDDRFVDYSYMFFWTVTPLFMGTWLYLRLEKKIIAS